MSTTFSSTQISTFDRKTKSVKDLGPGTIHLFCNFLASNLHINVALESGIRVHQGVIQDLFVDANHFMHWTVKTEKTLKKFQAKICNAEDAANIYGLVNKIEKPGSKMFFAYRVRHPRSRERARTSLGSSTDVSNRCLKPSSVSRYPEVHNSDRPDGDYKQVVSDSESDFSWKIKKRVRDYGRKNRMCKATFLSDKSLRHTQTQSCQPQFCGNRQDDTGIEQPGRHNLTYQAFSQFTPKVECLDVKLKPDFDYNDNLNKELLEEDTNTQCTDFPLTNLSRYKSKFQTMKDIIESKHQVSTQSPMDFKDHETHDLLRDNPNEYQELSPPIIYHNKQGLINPHQKMVKISTIPDTTKDTKVGWRDLHEVIPSEFGHHMEPDISDSLPGKKRLCVHVSDNCKFCKSLMTIHPIHHTARRKTMMVANKSSESFDLSLKATSDYDLLSTRKVSTLSTPSYTEIGMDDDMYHSYPSEWYYEANTNYSGIGEVFSRISKFFFVTPLVKVASILGDLFSYF